MLDQAVEERTRQLQREKFRAEEASRLQSEFLASISHEFRAPVQGILGITELMMKLDLSAEQREYMQASKASAESLLALLSELQDFSKIEGGRLELQNEKFHLARCAMSCLDAVRARATNKRIEVEFSLCEEIPELVIGDPVRLRQVLLNLLDNAVKFTSTGSVGVKVSPAAGCAADPGSLDLHFEVFDSGIGIPAHRQAAIFDAFLQSDTVANGLPGGTGLGLALARRLVQLMNGRIWVESQVGLGSRFHFTVRVGADGQSCRDEGPSDAAGSVHGLRLRILLAEDNSVNQVVTSRILETDGHVVMAAENGQTAVDMYRAGEFDLILMDVQMPELDGFQATAMIRDLQARTGMRTPILAMTAHATTEYRRKCLEAGMDGYVSKPVSSKELLLAVQEIAATRSPAQQLFQDGPAPSWE